ncbi:MAG: hypothetical protein ACP5IC_01710 [Minisyncoccia bacterium]
MRKHRIRKYRTRKHNIKIPLKIKYLVVFSLFLGMVIGSLSVAPARAFVFGSANQITQWIKDNTIVRLRIETNSVRVGSSGTLFADPNLNRVGIATTSPAYTLDINGDLRVVGTTTFSNFTAGSIPFIGASGILSQDNSNLFWDSTNKRLGIGTTTPAYTLDVNGNLRASLSLTAGINVETLSADKTLTPGTDKMYQFLSTGAANRIIYLATTTAKVGDRFVIKNNDAYNSSYYLQINQGTTYIDYIFARSIREYIFDGTNWVSADVGTGISSDRNVALGWDAQGYSYGAAVGYNVHGDSFGAAVGYNAYGNSYGAAVGYNAYGYSYGAAVGYYAYGNSNGAAVGYNVHGDSFGAAVGYNAYGNSYGAAVGYGARGMRYGAALGYQAGYNIDTSADRYNALVGAFAGYRITTGLGNIAIGYRAGYDTTYSPTTGSYNILLGYNAWTPATTTSNFLNIGGLIFGTNLSTTTNAVSSGNVGIGTIGPGEKLEVNGGIRLNTTDAKPTCDSFHRGTLWFTQGGAGVKDTLEVCAKDATDTYGWRTIY